MENNFSEVYHRILCSDFPDFLHDYISLPILSRLEGVGLLCGTDWTPLFHNSFYYSRLDHSIGTALIVWNFTGDKKQTLAALLHDVSTPAFSHVSDFKNGDALTQSSTENLNSQLIDADRMLQALLLRDGIGTGEVNDYHVYPVADNDMPGLSADRLEYMYPSGAALDSVWSLKEIKENYSCIKVLENERGIPEIGFTDMEQCVLYTKKFIEISMILQRNEDKIAMQMMADILSLAEKKKIVTDSDFFEADEKTLIERFSEFSNNNADDDFSRLFRTFRGMKKIIRSSKPQEGCYCVHLDVKRRYVNPLVRSGNRTLRISDADSGTDTLIKEFLAYEDSPFGCAEYL